MRLYQFDSDVGTEREPPISVFVVPLKGMGLLTAPEFIPTVPQLPLVVINGHLLGDAVITSIQESRVRDIGAVAVIQFRATAIVYGRTFQDISPAIDNFRVELIMSDDIQGELLRPSFRIDGVITRVSPEGDVTQLIDGGQPCR
jgi:hypothetical protein